MESLNTPVLTLAGKDIDWVHIALAGAFLFASLSK